MYSLSVDTLKAVLLSRKNLNGSNLSNGIYRSRSISKGIKKLTNLIELSMRFKGVHNKFFHANKIPMVGFEVQIAETQAYIFYLTDLFYIFYLLSIYILLTDPILVAELLI